MVKIDGVALQRLQVAPVTLRLPRVEHLVEEVPLLLTHAEHLLRHDQVQVAGKAGRERQRTHVVPEVERLLVVDQVREVQGRIR